jgi:hypothetical protein
MLTLGSQAISGGIYQLTLPQNQYGLFAVRYAGVNAASQTIGIADVGNILLNWNAQDKVNCPAQVLSFMNNLYGGVAPVSSASGAAFDITVFIRTGIPYDYHNIYDVGTQDNVYLKIDTSALVSGVKNPASGNVTIYGVPRRGYMNYVHKVLSKNVVAGGASTLTDIIPDANIGAIYMLNAGTLLTSVQVSRVEATGTRLIVNADETSVQDESDQIHILETSTSPALAIELGQSKAVSEYNSGQVKYQYVFNGAGTLAQYYGAIEYTPGKLQQSMVNAKR